MQEKPFIPSQAQTTVTPLWEIALLFLRLGLTAFGGPAAHIAMMRAEVVQRRKWLSEQRFLDLLGATNLIPGPNSTEMAIHIGYLRGGLPGLITAGACFILPAGLIVAGIAWGYVRYGNIPEVSWLFYGIQPVIVAIIFQALWNLGKQAVKGPLTGMAGAAVFLLYWLNINELILLFGAGLAVMILVNLSRLRGAGGLRGFLPALPVLRAVSSERNELWLATSFAGLSSAANSAVPYSMPLLFFTFLKIGSVLYGSGYVLLAFLRADFIQRLGWLTEEQLLNAVAIGQVTPGPVFTTATFIGYLVGGFPGAVVATLGIFLPAFLFVWISNPLIPRLRSSPWAGALLDGVNVASLGLMGGVVAQLGLNALADPGALIIGAAAGILLFWRKINPTWLVLGGGAAGLLRFLL